MNGKPSSELKVLGVAIVLMFALFALWWFLTVTWYGHASDVDKFGSPFGGVSALFAGIGCAGIAVSLWYQTRQLKSQQAEVAETTKALRDQVTALNSQANAINAQVEALMRPYMTVRISLQHDTARILVVENLGKTPARDLRMTLDRQYIVYRVGPGKGTNLQNAAAFSMPIDTFSPGMRLEYYLLDGHELHAIERDEGDLPSQFVITLKYKGTGESEYDERIMVDLMLHESTIVDTDYIRRELATLNKAMADLVDTGKQALRKL